MDVAGHFPEISRTAFYPGPEAMAHRGRAVNVILVPFLRLSLVDCEDDYFRRRRQPGARFICFFAVAHHPLFLDNHRRRRSLMYFCHAIQLVRWRHNPSRGQTFCWNSHGSASATNVFTPHPMCPLSRFGGCSTCQPLISLFANPARGELASSSPRVCGIAIPGAVGRLFRFSTVSHLSIRGWTSLNRDLLPHASPSLKNGS